MQSGLESCWKLSFSSAREEDVRFCGCKSFIEFGCYCGGLELKNSREEALRFDVSGQRRRLSFRRLDYK